VREGAAAGRAQVRGADYTYVAGLTIVVDLAGRAVARSVNVSLELGIAPDASKTLSGATARLGVAPLAADPARIGTAAIDADLGRIGVQTADPDAARIGSAAANPAAGRLGGAAPRQGATRIG
jgi:hypothetical protein